MADDFESFLDELAGTSEWKVFDVPPEGDPRVWLRDPQAPQLFFWAGARLPITRDLSRS